MTRNNGLMKYALMTMLCLHSSAKVMRNNALMNKMVSHFQNDNYASGERADGNMEQSNGNMERGNGNIERESSNKNHHQKPEKVLSLMQNVLCKNFPTIPCKIIIEDDTLKKLIEKSIQQIRHKTIAIGKTTMAPNYLTLFPMANSDELSNFLQIREKSPFFDKQNPELSSAKKKQKNNMNYWSKEQTQRKSKKNKKETKRTSMYNIRKKMRKFYPHKIKYKDKSNKNLRKDFGDYSEEKLSMSVEMPDMTLTKHHQHLSYKVEPAEPPVWRIDYMKHGEPSLNVNIMGREDESRLRGKIMKQSPAAAVDGGLTAPRSDVLHPDVYIKKNYVRKPADDNSDNLE